MATVALSRFAHLANFRQVWQHWQGAVAEELRMRTALRRNWRWIQPVRWRWQRRGVSAVDGLLLYYLHANLQRGEGRGLRRPFATSVCLSNHSSPIPPPRFDRVINHKL